MFFLKTDVTVGDRYVKVGSYDVPAWKVARISCANDSLPHAYLEREGGDRITLALHALGDTTLYRKLPSIPG